MGLVITTLSENTAGRGNFLGEWGLSFLVESDQAKILFDTGQSISAVHNAHLLGVNLNSIDQIVLSHGHYDHTGGLKQVLGKVGKEIDVVAHPAIWQDKYVTSRAGDSHIGIPFSRPELERLGARFQLRTTPTTLAANIMTTGEIPLLNSYETIEPHFVIKERGSYRPDTLRDDLALIIKTKAGLVVILGCAHRGIINTLHHARELTGVRTINTVVGGCHLIGAPESRITSTIAALKDMGVQRLGACHCTGPEASAMMAREFGDRFFFNNAGTVLKIE